MAALSPYAISPLTNRIRVTPTLQISSTPPRPVCSRANTLEKFSALSLHRIPTTPSSSACDDPAHNEGEDENVDLSHIFAIGDVADSGAIQAGHTAYWQAEVAARNILQQIEREEGRPVDELEIYKPGLPSIKITLGLVRSIPTLFFQSTDGVDRNQPSP